MSYEYERRGSITWPRPEFRKFFCESPADGLKKEISRKPHLCQAFVYFCDVRGTTSLLSSEEVFRGSRLFSPDALLRSTWGVDSYVTDTGVLVCQRGTKRGSLIRFNSVIMHHNAGCHRGLLKKVHKMAPLNPIMHSKCTGK